MLVCPAIAPSSAFLGGVLGFIDCQARTIGAEGYRALAAPGSSFSLVLSGLLALFVAIFGYRMLLGHVPTVREAVLAMVKVGLVLVLATGWPAYRTLIYDVVFEGPAELAGDIGRPAGLSGSGGLTERLQLADHGLVDLAIVGTGESALTPAARTAEHVSPPAFSGFEPFALGAARTFFLTSTIAALGSVRIIAGLLLALGPFFVAFLLFAGTRGLFEGWLRGLGGVALGALGTTIVLGVELALLEPRLVDWLAKRAAGLPAPGAAVEVLALSMVFALVLTAVLVAAAGVARGLRLPNFAELASRVQASQGRHSIERSVEVGGERPMTLIANRRAAATVEALAALQRRESTRMIVAERSDGPSSPSVGSSEGGGMPLRPVPIGRSFRRTRTRVSASAGRRDARA